MTTHKGWIGIDFDATLAEHTRGTHGAPLGPPISLMAERVRRWLARGHDVRIFTARVCSLQPVSEILEQETLIQAWCVEHLGQALPVTAEKDYHMWVLFDDRAVAVSPNTGQCFGPFPDELY